MIAYDVRGHGKSSRPDSYNLEDRVKDLYVLIDKLNLKKVHLLGHDMGGIIAENLPKNMKIMYYL